MAVRSGSSTAQISLLLAGQNSLAVKPELSDALLTAMIQSAEGVSDLLFAVGKPPVVEQHGSLEEFPIDTGLLTLEQIQIISHLLMQGEERLLNDLARLGSCDCSYARGDIVRFRVNIFKQNGR